MGRADDVYRSVLKVVEGVVGDQITRGETLATAGSNLIPGFQGVYAADDGAKVAEGLGDGESIVVNTDKRGEPGTHWMAVLRTGKKLLHYDSFGRPGKQISPFISKTEGGALVDTDLDAEQKGSETNCGARSLAWLIVADRWGIPMAKQI